MPCFDGKICHSWRLWIKHTTQSHFVPQWVEIAHQYNLNLFRSTNPESLIGKPEDPTFMNVAKSKFENNGAYRQNDKYLFKLEWWKKGADAAPQAKPSMTLFWNQSVWLTNGNRLRSEGYNLASTDKCESDSGVVQYGARSCQKGRHWCEEFHGLARSADSSRCMIDGNGKDGCWWNCVGVYNGWHNGGIPCYDQQICHSSRLWIWQFHRDT